MRIEWLNKTDTGVVILFFNGWGMDARATVHLKSEYDLVMFSDYRTLDTDDLPVLDSYKSIYIVAWSMGVWAASQTLPKMNITPQAQIAINGTEYPVDDAFGIPEEVYLLTENGLDERGLEKFFSRMLVSGEEIKRFKANKPCRNFAELRNELKQIRKASGGITAISSWDRVYISEKDIIFPVDNQQNWWSGRTDIRQLPGGHYPFYAFESWEEIIKL